MLENYEKLGKLGGGAQGSVYKVRHRTTKKEFALKMIKCRDSATANMALKEIKVLIQLRHANVVTYTDFFVDFDSRNPKEMIVCLVMELCEEQHLEHCIKVTRNEMMVSGKHPISERQVISWLIQGSHALQYIHSKGFIHRDLKPSNIFFANVEGQSKPQGQQRTELGGISRGAASLANFPTTLKLGDFGLATPVAVGELNKSAVGTPFYCAPEQLQQKKYDSAVDIWGLGAVILELITLRDRPVNSDMLSDPNAAAAIFADVVRMGFSKGLGAIVRDMLSKQPQARPTAALLVERLVSLDEAANGVSSPPILEPTHQRLLSFSGLDCINAAGEATLFTAALEPGRMCEMCQSSLSGYLCHDCGEALCSECDAAHHRIPSRKTHKRTPIEVATPLFLSASSSSIGAKLEVLQSAPVACQMCEGQAAMVLCPSCDSEVYCKRCDELKHINPKRRLHERILISRELGADQFKPPRSRKSSPTSDPLPLTGSIINTTAILTALAAASAVNSPVAPGRVLAPAPQTRRLSISKPLQYDGPEPSTCCVTPLAPPLIPSSLPTVDSIGRAMVRAVPSNLAMAAATVNKSRAPPTQTSYVAPTTSLAASSTTETAVPKRIIGSGAPIHPALVDKYLTKPGSALRQPLSLIVPSTECQSLADAMSIIALAQQQPLASGARNDRVLICGDLSVTQPLVVPSSSIDIIGHKADTQPRLTFNCTPALTLTSPTQQGSTVICTLANLNIVHDVSLAVHAGHNKAKVSALTVDGGHWKVEQCRFSSTTGQGVIAEGPSTVASFDGCEVVSAKMCGFLLLNGVGGEITNSHIVDAKQTGILVRKGVTARITKNHISQNGETGIYIVDSTLVVSENEITQNLGCGIVVKGGDASPTLRDNTVAGNTQAGIFYCDGSAGTCSDNVISDNQRAGILIKTRADPTVTRNTVRKSKETGIYCFEEGKGTITHNTITENLNAGILVTTLANVTVMHNAIHKNYYEALWVCKNGQGTFTNNDLRNNRKGPKDVEAGSRVVLAGNLEA